VLATFFIITIRIIKELLNIIKIGKIKDCGGAI